MISINAVDVIFFRNGIHFVTKKSCEHEKNIPYLFIEIINKKSLCSITVKAFINKL